MSLESKIEALTAAVVNLTNVIVKIEAAQAAPVAPTPIVTATPVAQAPAAPAPVVETPAAPLMPTPPTFAPPVAPAPALGASAALPFSDVPGLIKYVMDSYQKLGPTKGAEIQKVLTGLGYSNINDVKSEHYVQFYAGVEALKGGA